MRFPNLSQGETGFSAGWIRDSGCGPIGEHIVRVCGARRCKCIAGNTLSSSSRDSGGNDGFLRGGFLGNRHRVLVFGGFRGLLVGGSLLLIFGAKRGIHSSRIVFGFSSLAHALQLGLGVSSNGDLAGSSGAVQDAAGHARKKQR